MITEDPERTEWVEGLFILAQFIRDNPDFPLPTSFDAYVGIHGDDAKSELAEMTRVLGTAKKAVYGDWFSMERSFGPHKVSLNSYRYEVCERVVAGTETVEVPDPEAPTVSVEREVVEWVCPQSILEAAT